MSQYATFALKLDNTMAGGGVGSGTLENTYPPTSTSTTAAVTSNVSKQIYDLANSNNPTSATNHGTSTSSTVTVGASGQILNLNGSTINLNGSAYSTPPNLATSSGFGTSATSAVTLGVNTQILNLNGSTININGTPYSTSQNITTASNFGTSATSALAIGITSQPVTINTLEKVIISSPATNGAKANLVLDSNDPLNADGSDVSLITSQYTNAGSSIDMLTLQTQQKTVAGIGNGNQICGDFYLNTKTPNQVVAYATATWGAGSSTSSTTLTITNFISLLPTNDQPSVSWAGYYIKFQNNTSPNTSTVTITGTPTTSSMTVSLGAAFTFAAQTTPIPIWILSNASGLSCGIRVNGADNRMFINSDALTFYGQSIDFRNALISNFSLPTNVVNFGTTASSTVNVGLSGVGLSLQGITNPITVGGALSDETTTLTTSNKLSIRLPFSINIRTGALPYWWVNTLPTSTTAITFDILKNGTTIYSTKPTLSSTATNNSSQNGTLSSNPTTFSAGDLLVAQVSVVGSGTPNGAKVIIFHS